MLVAFLYIRRKIVMREWITSVRTALSAVVLVIATSASTPAHPLGLFRQLGVFRKSMACGALARSPAIQSFDQIHPLVQKWMLERERLLIADSNAYGKFKPSDLVSIGDLTVKVLIALGSGGEGRAMLVQSDQGLMVLKKFHYPNMLRRYRQYYGGKDSPRVLAEDLDEGMLLLEYVEGIPVDVFFDSKQWKPLGISEQECAKIQAQWDRTHHPKDWKPNYVYSFKLGSFLEIDPI